MGRVTGDESAESRAFGMRRRPPPAVAGCRGVSQRTVDTVTAHAARGRIVTAAGVGLGRERAAGVEGDEQVDGVAASVLSSPFVSALCVQAIGPDMRR
ncbi:MAG: hypothetical protein ACE5GW_09875 [Planctomycetota bacterium]